ncbi:hypothetical protein D3C76_1613510 [compost metagenome]
MRHQLRSGLAVSAWRCSSKPRHRLTSPAKSESASFHWAWAWSAACWRSGGRSRGSWIDMALATISTSCKLPSFAASNSMRPMRGSTGRRANWRPSGVNWLLRSTAESSCSRL